MRLDTEDRIMLYSKSTGGFYAQEIHGNNIPADAVEISDELYSDLMLAQSAGKVISADSSGRPAAIDPPVVPDPVPAVVSRFQARRALKDAGVFDQVEAAIAQADEFAHDAWADAQEFRRDSALILSLGESLGLDLDALFIAAAKIEA